jgi:hypothetical protein
MVEDHLRDHPDADWGPVAIGKALHRSSGAVANALEILVKQDLARRTSDRPKRYRLVEHAEAAPATRDHADGAHTTVPPDVSPADEVNPCDDTDPC